MLFTCMPAMYTCARSHIVRQIISKLGGTFYGSQRVAWATCMLLVRLRACTMRVCEIGASVNRTLLDEFAHKVVETFLCMGYVLFTHAFTCAHYACVCTACMCAFADFLTDSLQTACKHSMGRMGYFMLCTHLHMCIIL
jgi:hypothetical protein